jgi:hypothetical protein
MLRNYIRKVLTEAMKVVSDLPDGYYVEFEELDDDLISLALVSETDGGVVFLEAKKVGPSWPSAGPCNGGWIVIQTSTYEEAPEGFGPLLYDIAMEYATRYGNGLTPDRSSVSEAAEKVWEKYMNRRDDVTWVQLDDYDHPHGPWATKNPEQTSCKNFAVKKKLYKSLEEMEKAILTDESAYREKFLASPLTKMYQKPNPTRIKNLLRSPGKFIDQSWKKRDWSKW